ncbi:MAG: hypothetical protein AVDCRST_MAG68-966 [uncultured Gemmatimonadetes bacterium]|uniref:Uncharacterized protein n=1 Tax=uncultured Gemmatimonadota bacterium TaxID=203437 RepID=A0A6J4KKI5_9BACT|nr:MAG: hypothetical protein AVDCRST_MAG68-966 [uncultured Gemmatimonadota bacterium]
MRESAAARLFAGSGEMRALCRALDREATPLGAVEGWAAALRNSVRLCLDSGFAMCVFAGPRARPHLKRGLHRGARPPPRAPRRAGPPRPRGCDPEFPVGVARLLTLQVMPLVFGGSASGTRINILDGTPRRR